MTLLTENIVAQAESTHRLNEEELVTLLQDDSCNDIVFQAADRVRQKYMGNAVHLRGLIEFTNICRQNCCYCGLRRENSKVDRYRLDEDTIVSVAQKAQQYGYKTVVLQGGEDPYYTVERMVYILKRIKALGVAITLSLGERSRDEYRAFKEAGADRFLLRIETTDQALYEKLDPGMSWNNRIRCLKDLKELGFEAGTGCLVGLPGQSIQSLARDILFFKEFNADMIGVGPFIPNADTPLKDAPSANFWLSVKVMALTRLLCGNINIPATTAMETIHPNGRIIALQAGANVVMPNVSDGEYRKKYLLYPGKAMVDMTPVESRDKIVDKIVTIGRTIGTDCGFRPQNRL